MTTPAYEVVVTLVDGNARELSRTFRSGQLLVQLSVGSQGDCDWIVSAEGVASVHLLLQFDGQRLYAAGAGGGATAYLQNIRVSNTWNEVADRSELRFGQARMKVLYRLVAVSSSTPPAHAPARVEPRQLTPIERAAALPLPAFFSDRLRTGSNPSLGAPVSPRALSREPLRASPRHVTPAAASSSRPRRTRGSWLVLIIPAAVLPFIFGFLWATGFGHRAEVPAALPAPSATTLALPAPSARFVEPPPVQRSVALPEPRPAAGALATALPNAAESLPSTTALISPTPKAYRLNVADKPVPRTGEEPWMISEEWRAHHERQLHAPNRARAKVIFLGDSITEGWGLTPAYQDSFGKYTPLNLGLAGDFTQNVLWRIDQGALTGTNPEVLVLMIGVNNLAGGFSPQETVAGIQAILVAVQAHLPNSRVLLLGILPARQDPADPLRRRIVEANRLLASLALPARVSLHDVGSVLFEADGTLSKAMLRDFLHPTAAGYQRLSAAVAPLLDALMGQPAE